MKNQTPAERIEGIYTAQLIKRGHEVIIDLFMVPNNLLPEKYRGTRSHKKLRSVVNQARILEKDKRDPRSVKGSLERCKTLDRYRETVEDIEYDVNESLLYNHMLSWVTAMIKGEKERENVN